MGRDTVVSDVAEYPHLVPRLIEGFRQEWPEWCASVSPRELERTFESGNPGELPAILVATGPAGEVRGTIALRPYFAAAPMAETPWVRQLYVFPEYRGRGVYPALADAVAQRARDLGFGRLYAATNRIEPLLRRGGWEAFRRVTHDGAPMAWLRKSLTD